MKKFIVFGIFAIVATLCISSVKAELIYGTFAKPPYTFINESVNQSTEKPKITWAGGISGQNLITKEPLQFFCADLYVESTWDFLDPGVGQEYQAVSLLDAPLTETQKTAIQALFDHVYNPLLEASIYGENIAEIFEAAFQIAIWEIIHEDSGTWDISNGSFKLTGAEDNEESANYGRSGNVEADEAFALVQSYTSSWFTSIDSGDWTNGEFAAKNFDGSRYVITYFYIADNPGLSQPFFAVTDKEWPVDPHETVPEPVSLLILGLGLAGVPFFRRKK